MERIYPVASGLANRHARGSAVPLGQRSVWHKPALLKAADACDALVVAVVVNERDASLFGGCSDQEVDWRDTAMVAAGGEERLQLTSSCPEVGAHRDRLEGVESFRDLLNA